VLKYCFSFVLIPGMPGVRRLAVNLLVLSSNKKVLFASSKQDLDSGGRETPLPEQQLIAASRRISLGNI